MPFDQNNNFTSNHLGKDRLGHTTPDCDATEPIQPFLPKSYPAPWLPSKRRDDAHPAGINVTVSHANIVGVDKSGYLIPAGLFCGAQKTKAQGGKFCYIQYSSEDLALGVTNPATGNDVVSPTERVLIAAPSDADEEAGEDVVDQNDPAGTAKVHFSGAEVAFAKACDLIPGGVARGIGYALRNMWQNLVIPDVADRTNGILYNVDSMNPVKFRISNYSPEMGNAIRTSFVLRVPWIGDNPNKLAQLAAADGVTGYSQTAYSKSFTHFTGVKGNAAGELFQGCLVVPSMFAGDAGNYMPFDATKHSIDQVVGHVIGVENHFPIKDYKNRVRTQFERGQQFKGAFTERNAVTGLMGGSATRGVSYQLSVGSNGIFRAALDQGKAIHDEYTTTVLVMITLS